MIVYLFCSSSEIFKKVAIAAPQNPVDFFNAVQLAVTAGAADKQRFGTDEYYFFYIAIVFYFE